MNYQLKQISTTTSIGLSDWRSRIKERLLESTLLVSSNLYSEDSRAKYLRWVNNWKIEYKLLSEAIRRLKTERKHDFIKKNKAFFVKKFGEFEVSELAGLNQSDIETTLKLLRFIATLMLTKRRDMRKLSWLAKQSQV